MRLVTIRSILSETERPSLLAFLLHPPIIDEIKEYFDYMAKLTGTLWENDSTGASCNHGFASHVIRFIFRDCLGIESIDEVNKKVCLNSDYNAPENAKAVIPLKNGSIKVTVEDGARRIDIQGDYEIG